MIKIAEIIENTYFLVFLIFFKIYTKMRVKLGDNSNINKRDEEIKKKRSYVRDKKKVFEQEKRSELQHIIFLRKKKKSWNKLL
jgi:Na+/phosphate symporter